MSETSRLPEALRALRYPNYRLFISGQLVSLVGTWLQSVAQSWLVYRLTGSAALLGLVAFSGQFPVLLLAPLGGALADRYERRRILIVTQSCSMLLAVLLGALTLAGKASVAAIFAIAGGLGIVNAFDIPARQALVPQLVDRRDLGNAIAINSSVFSSARTIGPAVAGLLVGAVGEGWCFMLNGASYIAVIANLARMRLASRGGPESPRSPLADMRDGLAFVARNRPIRSLLAVVGTTSVCGLPYLVLMPVFARDVLGGDARSLGLLMGATGVGALGAGVFLAVRTGVDGLGHWVARAGVLFGLALIAFAGSSSLHLSAALLVPTGFANVLMTASTNTLLQTLAPEAMRGRVMSTFAMVIMGLAPFGSFAAGMLAHRFGAQLTVACGGAVCVIAASAFAVALPGLTREMRALAGGRASASADDDRPPP